jgi:branched-chain amino acid transport system permease protein
MMMVILGGMGTLVGPIIGAAVWMLLELAFQSLPTVAGLDLGKHWQLWMGIFIVIAALALPGGLTGVAAAMFKRRGAGHG